MSALEKMVWSNIGTFNGKSYVPLTLIPNNFCHKILDNGAKQHDLSPISGKRAFRLKGRRGM